MIFWVSAIASVKEMTNWKGTAKSVYNALLARLFSARESVNALTMFCIPTNFGGESRSQFWNISQTE